MQDFDSKTVDDFDFWKHFADGAEYPPGPSFPLPLDDEFELEGYFFEDLNNRYRLTETGKLNAHHSKLSHLASTYNDVPSSTIPETEPQLMPFITADCSCRHGKVFKKSKLKHAIAK